MEPRSKDSVPAYPEGSSIFVSRFYEGLDRMLSTYYTLISYYFFLAGSSKIPSLSIPRKVGTGAWGIPLGKDAYHASSDASLFSSSLPVLPHEKCM